MGWNNGDKEWKDVASLFLKAFSLPSRHRTVKSLMVLGVCRQEVLQNLNCCLAKMWHKTLAASGLVLAESVFLNTDF